MELLPMVLRQYLDMPGPTGLSPYEIVFGRTRYISGVPYAPLRESEDAKRFFDRMQKQEIKVAEVLNELHQKTVEQINKRRKEFGDFKLGEKVWYLRPDSLSADLESRWVGPYEIDKKTGSDSYEIVRFGTKKGLKAAHV